MVISSCIKFKSECIFFLSISTALFRSNWVPHWNGFILWPTAFKLLIDQIPQMWWEKERWKKFYWIFAEQNCKVFSLIAVICWHNNRFRLNTMDSQLQTNGLILDTQSHLGGRRFQYKCGCFSNFNNFIESILKQWPVWQTNQIFFLTWMCLNIQRDKKLVVLWKYYLIAKYDKCAFKVLKWQ